VVRNRFGALGTGSVPDEPAPSTPTVTVDEFFRTEIRAGVVTRAEQFPKARKPAYKLWIDFGELGTKRSSAQITALYEADELVGRTVLAVTNFPPRQVADFVSEVLVLGVPVDGTDEVVLITPDRPVTPGVRVS
jgi:tRNA-binding protein